MDAISQNPTPAVVPVPPPPTRATYVVMAAAVLAMLLASLDSLILGTAMPTIVGDLGGLDHLSWVASGYMLATAAATPIWGKLGDMYGRKGCFLASITLFLVGSALCGLAQSMGQLIGLRVLQGLGGGGLMVGALSLIGELVTPQARGKFQAMASTSMGAAMVAGPLVGGFLTDHLGWRSCFYVNVPIGVLALVMITVALRIPARRASGRIDYLGAVLLSTAIVSLVLMTTWAGTKYDWVSVQIIGLGVLAVAATVALIAVERRVAEPVLPLAIFRSRNFCWANVLAFLSGFVMVAAMTFLPIFQQTVQGASATNAGLLMLPLLLSMVAVNLFAGQLISGKGNFTRYALIGSALIALGVFLLSLMDIGTGPWVTGAYMAVFGAGLGFATQVTLSVGMESVGRAHLGVSSSTVTLSRTLGGSFGVSLAGIVFAQQMADGAKKMAGGHGGPGGPGGPGAHPAPSAGAHLSAESLRALPAAARDAYEHAVASGTHQVFVYCTVAGVLAFASAWFIRTRTQVAAVAAAAAAAAAAKVPSAESAAAH
ncbi:DHA2 family efflux MFS transporter permease subunit [Kitasatospora sp. NPDC096077]|uniref:DHA2 family efflux MFS transporter permease subunit n=1 Tax=Kitasatospora sp. NPDC096077 TaxID=3155544 RepID=UPI0033326FD6